MGPKLAISSFVGPRRTRCVTLVGTIASVQLEHVRKYSVQRHFVAERAEPREALRQESGLA